MLSSLREKKRENSKCYYRLGKCLDSLFKEVRVFKVFVRHFLRKFLLFSVV